MSTSSVTLSAGARQFVTPLLFEALGAMPVYGEMFAPGEDPPCPSGAGPARQAMLVAPASADALSRLAQGAASDMLSAQALAFEGPLLLAPAMNPRMWRHPATQANVALLRERGARLILPDCGRAACGDEGQGRLAPVEQLFWHTLRALSPQDMAGRRVLVTLGPTREPWDGVRYWSNPSSGRMGGALALAAWLRGAEVTAVCGPGCPALPPEIRRLDVLTARRHVRGGGGRLAGDGYGLLHGGGSRFLARNRSGRKNSRKKARRTVSASASRPIPTSSPPLPARRRPGQKTLGFAAETAPDMEALMSLARAKRARKDADLLAGNRINGEGSGFGSPTNSMAVTDRSGHGEIWPQQGQGRCGLGAALMAFASVSPLAAPWQRLGLRYLLSPVDLPPELSLTAEPAAGEARPPRLGDQRSPAPQAGVSAPSREAYRPAAASANRPPVRP